MKILHMVNTYAAIGGIETYVINLLPLLASKGHENLLIFRNAHPRTPDTNRQKFIHVPITADTTRDNACIQSIVQDERPDVIYLHDADDPELVILLSRLAPTAGYVHIFYPVCPGLGKLYRRTDTVCNRAYGPGCIPNIYINRCATAKRPSNVFRIMQKTRGHIEALRQLPCVVVASNYMRDLMIQNGVAPEKVEVLPPHFILPTAGSARLQDKPRANVMFAGRLEYEKGVPYLLEALQQLPNCISLTIAGSGSYQEEHKRQARELGVADRVQFKQWLSSEELERHYQTSAATVMPTIMPEPFGKVGVEAMANGCPVVAFDVGGISDWLKDGDNGFLVPARDSQQLAYRIKQLTDDPALGKQLGENGRRFVEENYAPQKHLGALTRILERTVMQCS